MFFSFSFSFSLFFSFFILFHVSSLLFELNPARRCAFQCYRAWPPLFPPTPPTMSTQGGLQRRRVAAASTSSNGFVDPDEDRPTRPNTTPTTSNSNVHGDGAREGRVAHAGTAMEGGSKVAYDPRDLVGAGSGGTDDSKVPKLTLLEEILLLGIKDRAVRILFGDLGSAPPTPCRGLHILLLNSPHSAHDAVQACTGDFIILLTPAHSALLFLGIAIESRTNG